MAIKRRQFLSHIAAGSAVLTMPAFVAGCGVSQIKVGANATPHNPFFDWFGVDDAMIVRVMAELTTGGADLADLYFQHQRSNSMVLEDGIVSHGDAVIMQGVGLRLVIGEQSGYAFTEDLTLGSMLAAARTASAIANGSRAIPPQAFVPQKNGELYVTEVPWSDIGIDKKLPLLEYVDGQARKADPSINKVTVRLSDVDDRVMIATLDGHLITDHRPMTRLSTQVRATRSGESQTGFSSIAARADLQWYTDDRIDNMVQEAVDRTLVLFDARRPPTGDMPVILASGASGILLHEAIGHALEADFNHHGKSAYSGMMGKKVAEPLVSLIDQATMPNQRGALNYDDEGTRCGRTVMVENGVLRSYLHDSISAKQYKVAATGSGRRQSYKFSPMPRMTCTYMEDGPHTREEIIAAIDHGIIAETYTDGRVNIGPGDYTFYVKHGWLVEQGKITAPIKDLNISGNGPETLGRITMVANDGRFDTGGWTCGKNGQSVPVSQGIPTVLVSTMTVGDDNA